MGGGIGGVVSDVEAIRSASQDAGTRMRIDETCNRVVPLLMLKSWVQRIAGADGLGCWDRAPRTRVNEPGTRLIHSIARCEGDVWSHVSVSLSNGRMPSWEVTRDVFRLVHPDRSGVIVIPPADRHVNIAEVSHVWCCLSRPAVPDFTYGTGSI